VLYAEGAFEPCEDRHYYPIEDDQQNNDETCRGELDIVTNFDSTMKNLAIFVFSFTCHQNVFSIVNELERPTQRRVDSVIALAIGSAFVLYMIVAIEGYKTYGSNVKGDILLNYPQNGLVTMVSDETREQFIGKPPLMDVSLTGHDIDL
jgi:amino acid permease